MKTNTWLDKATTKDQGRPEHFQVVHGNISTDGFRLHRNTSMPATCSCDKCQYDLGWASIYIPSRPRNRATISRADLINAAKQALALRDELDRKHKNAPIIRFSMNGSFTYSAEWSESRISGEIVDGYKFVEKVTTSGKGKNSRTTYHTHRMTYTHHNPDKPSEFALSPYYLLDALSGMEGETIELDAPGSTAPVYITDGTHEATIMPIVI